MNAPKDRNGNALQVGDTVDVQFEVLQATHDGPGTNLKLKLKNVPAGENVATLHIHSGATLRVVPPLSKPTAPAESAPPIIEAEKAPPAEREPA